MHFVVTTMTTVGYGAITPEENASTMQTIVLQCLGVLTYGYTTRVISSMLNSFQTVSSLEYHA